MSQKIQCIGIILDGNRRWAKAQGLPSLEGHRKGAENLKTTARAVRDRSIPHLVVYAFSTENWKRSSEEVAHLMTLFREFIAVMKNELEPEGIRIRFIGERERFDTDSQKGMHDAEEATAANTRMTLWICLSYGGRAEILAAANASTERSFTEESLHSHMWSADMPDPDIIIRTGGEHRLSNFLLWQAAYSELFFVDEYWPAFSEASLDRVLAEYGARERRLGA